MRTLKKNSDYLLLFAAFSPLKACSYLEVSLFNLFLSPLLNLHPPLTHLRLWIWIFWLVSWFSSCPGWVCGWLRGSLAQGLEFRGPFQNCNYLGCSSIKGLFWSINPSSWPNPISSCKSPLGKIKITFINFFLLNNWKNMTKPLRGKKPFPDLFDPFPCELQIPGSISLMW